MSDTTEEVRIGRIILLTITLASIGSSLCTIAGTLMCPPTLRKRVFVQIANYIALSDIISGLGYVLMGLGVPQRGIACSFQGFVTTMFYFTTCFWAAIAIRFTYRIVQIDSVGRERLTIGYREHFLCWGMPLVLTLLPLSQSQGYSVSAVEGAETSPWAVCYTINSTNPYANVWFIMTLLLPIYALGAYMIFEAIRIHLILRKIKDRTDSRLGAVTKFQGYVINVAVTQIFPFMLVISAPTALLGNCIALTAGFTNSFLFWFFEHQIRDFVTSKFRTYFRSSYKIHYTLFLFFIRHIICVNEIWMYYIHCSTWPEYLRIFSKYNNHANGDESPGGNTTVSGHAYLPAIEMHGSSQLRYVLALLNSSSFEPIDKYEISKQESSHPQEQFAGTSTDGNSLFVNTP